MLKVQNVFTPNDTPVSTYVERSELKLEQSLREYNDTPNIVVSLSGPSKSGKTVLVKKVVAPDCLITVTGSGLTSPEDLWRRVLNWMGSPSSMTKSSNGGWTVAAGGEAGGKAGVPFFAQGEAKVTANVERGWGSETTQTYEVDGLTQVIKDIAKSEFVVFIDDFHYIAPSLRQEIGRQIKAAAENGVKIFTASVPHRSDDVVRSNPELRGRVVAIDFKYWSQDELCRIARQGFKALNAEIAPAVERRLASEAFGSPQLMQVLCLNLCYSLGITGEQKDQVRIEVSDDVVNDALLKTSTFTDSTKMLSALHTGPRTRGTERKEHTFTDGTKGDVYRAILLAMKENPALLSFSYDNIYQRVKSVCIGDAPVGSSIVSALEQMSLRAGTLEPDNSPIAWDGDALDVADPYFLYFLRFSEKLASLAEEGKPS